MNSENRQVDDFKKLFDVNQIPELPMGMEENVMLGIEIENLKRSRSKPNWISTNLVIFSLSLAFLVVLSVLEYAAQSLVPMLVDIKLLLLFSTGIFFILWVIESAEELLEDKFSKDIRSSVN